MVDTAAWLVDREHTLRSPHPPKALDNNPRPRTRRRYTWAQLLKRVFLLDVLNCHHCGATRKLLAFLTDPRVVDKSLAHLDLPTDSPPVAPARPPPEPPLPFA